MPIVPKYRSLMTAELQSLEQEFVEFLILNGITAPDWERLKVAEPEKATDLTVLFSDVILEGVLRKIAFLEFRSATEVHTFQCLSQKMVLVGLRTANPEVDFTNPDFLRQAATSPPAGVEVFTTEKPYHQPRELELFQMTEQGCVISDGQLFKTLAMLLQERA